MILGTTSFSEEADPSSAGLVQTQEKELALVGRPSGGERFGGSLSANMTALLKDTGADNASKDPAKMICYSLPAATSCPVITGQSGSGNNHRDGGLGQDFQPPHHY